MRKQKYLKERMRVRGLTVSFHNVEASFLEAAFARGGRELAPAIARAAALGCRFDGWSDQFRPDLWAQAFKDVGIDPSAWANKSYAYDEPLPWDHIDMGVSKRFLVREAERAARAELTPDCRTGACAACGACADGVKTRLAGEAWR